MFNRRKNEPQKLCSDYYLRPYAGWIERRKKKFNAAAERLSGGGRLKDFASGHEYFGLHRDSGGWVLREWAPNAEQIFLVGDFNGWRELPEFKLRKIEEWGVWELRLLSHEVNHGDHYLLKVYWPGGSGLRIPAYCRYTVQDDNTKLFSAMVWNPEKPYKFKHKSPSKSTNLFIYESHIGMAQEEPKVGSFREYTEKILPRIAAAGYNTIELMAIMNHPYYGSFGYHVANFFSIASRFGTPDEFKELVDTAHGMGLRVIMDLVHSHAVRNEQEGLARLDGTRTLYFHEGGRGEHPGWDSLLFDYGKDGVIHFLLSNCRFWLDEYRLDGFRFDGVTSMLYKHHGLGKAFTAYLDYFNDDVDEDAYTYLALANSVIHEVNKDAITIAEDVSGMPGLGAPVQDGGCGFDFRLAMGVTDYWFKLFDIADENWDMGTLWHELTNRRNDERTVSYVESHDQAIVGGQTAIFRLVGDAIYKQMSVFSNSIAVDRGVALHKMARLFTAATAGNGYLNFMGNEFGHPEWIDFPREGNGWSYHYARRQWSLADQEHLRYYQLQSFDRAMLKLLKESDIYSACPQLIAIDNNKKIIAFERNNLWFFGNFHPVDSYVDISFQTLAGEYELVLDSDNGIFNGHNRVAPDQHYFTIEEQWGDEKVNALRLYLPSRTVLVLRKI